MTQPGARRRADHRSEWSAEEGAKATPERCSADRTGGFGTAFFVRHTTNVVTSRTALTAGNLYRTRWPEWAVHRTITRCTTADEIK
jgi:hypothetical protein